MKEKLTAEILKKYFLDKVIEFRNEGKDYKFKLVEVWYNPQTKYLTLLYESA